MAIGNPNLTAREQKHNYTVPGMAHWAGTGPPGTTCATCRFHFGWCKKFRSMMTPTGQRREKLIRVPDNIPSCKYYEQKAAKK